MFGKRNTYGLRRSLSVGLIVVLLSLALPPTGQAEMQQAGQATAWRLPFVRMGHTQVYDEHNDRLIIFGGWNGQQFFNDVWALNLEVIGVADWVKLNPDNVWPGARGQHTAIYDQPNDRMIVYGGHGMHYDYDDVWALDLTTPGAESWTQLQPGGETIGPRRYHTAIRDETGDRMLVFGGVRGGALRNDVWALDLTPGAEAWSSLAVTGSVPAARAQHTTIYDDENELMIVFGGVAAGGLRNDTWALDLTTQHWAQMAPAGTPPSARRGHTSVLNDCNDYMLVFGGLGSSGFLNDMWRLDLTPGSRQWMQLSPTGGPPAPRAWHTATFKRANSSMVVLGGRGMPSLTGETQWYLNVGGIDWEAINPPLPDWWSGGTALQSVQSDGMPEVTLRIEDAPLGTRAHLLVNSEVWFVVKLQTTNPAYASDIDVVLDVVQPKFDVTGVGLRPRDADEVTSWTVPPHSGGGRYRLEDVDLVQVGAGKVYQMQVVFKAVPKAEANGTPITAVAKGPTWTTALESSATARIHLDPPAWIITNRTQLFAQYDNSEVRSLLDEVYEVASDRSAVVFYLDRFIPDLADWDNTTVVYTDEPTANHVADQVADWLAVPRVAGAPPVTAYPTYLAIIGDDNIIPFYRNYDDAHREASFVANADPVLEALVDNNYFFTDNPYGDQQYGTGDADWERGELESAVGRIVGATAADMEKGLTNSALAPDPAGKRAIIASSGDIWNWHVPGGQNDALYLLNTLDYGYNSNLVDDNPSKTDITREMAKGFSAMLLGGHGTVYGWIAPGGAGDDWPDLEGPEGIDAREMEEYDSEGDVSAHRLFYYFGSCRVGLSHNTQGAYGSMIYALTHHEASGGIASAGEACCVSDETALSPSEALSNAFWVVANSDEDRSDPLGWALKEAKRIYTPANGTWSADDKGTVQKFTYFGLPWMRMVGAEHSTLAQESLARDTAETTTWSPPQLMATDATYAVVATTDASTYTVTQTADGFDLIDVAGMGATFSEGELVLPSASIDLILPLSATISSLVFTPTQSLVLNDLDIPVLQYEAGATAITATNTSALDGVYPVTATFESGVMDTYQLVQVNVIPVTYDATVDRAILYRQVEVAVTYDTPETIALTSFEPDKLQYLPGETITTSVGLLNAGDAVETVTATLVLQDNQGQIVGYKASEPVDIPAGGAHDLKLGWTGLLDGDTYLARMFIWRAGHIVAGAGTRLEVAAGEVSNVSVPVKLMPGEEGTFALTFDNLSSSAQIALAGLAIYDQDDSLAAYLPSQGAIVAGGGSATLSFAWTPTQPGDYRASFVLMAGGDEYGPLSEGFEVQYHRVYLPLVMRH